MSNIIQSGHRPQARHGRDRDGDLQSASAKVDLRTLCEQIYCLQKQGDAYFSPVRDDGRNAAFTLRDDGEVGIDHGTGEGFNALKLIARVENLSPAEARRRLDYYSKQGQAHPFVGSKQNKSSRGTTLASFDRHLYPFDWPLGIGTHDDYLRFATLRGLDPVSLITATALNLFFFLDDLRGGQRICVVTDDARYVRQDRRVDGQQLAFNGDRAAKCRTIGAASWPVGAANIGAKPVVLLVEGMPDLLAAVQVIGVQGRHHDTAAVAMLGAGQKIHPQSFPYFAGKYVRLFPHRDEAGSRATETWCRQLQRAGATVDCFNHERFGQKPSQPCKDLNDLIVIHGADHAEDMIPTVEAKEVPNASR